MAFTEGIICPILDALRGNVYTALYHFERDELIRDTDYMIISVEELLKLLVKKIKVYILLEMEYINIKI